MAPMKVMGSLSLIGQSYNADGPISDKITKSWTETVLKKKKKGRQPPRSWARLQGSKADGPTKSDKITKTTMGMRLKADGPIRITNTVLNKDKTKKRRPSQKVMGI